MSMRVKAALVIMSIVFVFTSASFFLSFSFTQRYMSEAAAQEQFLEADSEDVAAAKTNVQIGLFYSALILLIVGTLVSVSVSGIVSKPFKTIEHQSLRISNEHERTTLLLDAMPLSCCILDKDQRILRCNEGTVRLFELSDRQDFIDHFYDYSPEFQPDGQPSETAAAAYIAKAFNEGACVCEWMHKKRDGTLIPTEITLIRIIYDGENVVAAYVRDQREYRRMMNDIQRRDELFNVINHIAVALLQSEPHDFDTNLVHCMGMMADAVSVDRVYIWENNTIDGKLYCTQLYEWSGGAEPQQDKDLTVNVSYDDIAPEWEETLSSGDNISGYVRNMQPKIKAQLSAQSILSIFVMPLFVRDRFWGFVGFDDCHKEREFPENEKSILQSGCILMVNALLRNTQVVKIREAHDRATIVLNKMPFACHLWNRDLEIFDCNDENRKLFKISDKESFINNFQNYIPEYQPDGQRSISVAHTELQKAFSDGKRVYEEFIYLAADGTQVPVEIILVRIPFDDDYVVAAYLRDLREHKQMMEEIEHNNILLEEALNEATKANAAKSSFLANMSHEMRTPLNAIIGLTDLTLGNDRLDNETYSNIEKINNAGMALLSTVNDILDISKIEAGKFELVPVIYDIPSLVNDTITQSIAHKEEKPIRFILNIDSSLPSRLYGDELRVKQILNNLLSNAFKYTKEGTVEFGIHCENTAGERADDIGKHGDASGEVVMTVYVKDTGIGVSPEYINNIFDDYSQMDMRSNRNIMGTGLGLSITKRMVDMMNGTITVESEYGRGSTFTVMLPQGFVGETTIGPEMAENLRNFHYYEQKRKQIAKLSRLRLPYARVLVVDDVATNLDVARGLMKPYGMQIDCVSSGREAIDAIRDEKVRYNAVFMDHMMPGMDGIEATRHIRELGTQYAAAIPIIALTANAITGNEEMFLENGFQAFISKPIELSRLDAVIRLWVRDKEQEKLFFDRQINVGRKLVPYTLDSGESDESPDKSTGAGKRIVEKLSGKLDMSKGLARFSGSEDVYLEVLRSYAVNTGPLLEKAKAVRKDDLADYAITVHGIKGSSRGIYAEAIGNKAEALERAAEAGDFDFISENNRFLIEDAEDLISGLEFLLEDTYRDKQKKDEPPAEILTNLLTACRDFDMDRSEAVIAELEQYDYESGNDLVAMLRGYVDEANFLRIIDILSYLDT